MENLGETAFFVLLGVVCCWLGLAVGGFQGSIFLGMGLDWFIVGVIFALAKREVGIGGTLLGFFLGVLGSIIWLLLSISREKANRHPEEYRSWRDYQKATLQEEYKCGTCLWFGKEGCKRKEKYINSEPCSDYERGYRYY